MKIRTILFYLAILLLLPFALKFKAGDFGQGQSLFSDIKANKVGDILTVITDRSPILLEKSGSGHIQLLNQNETDSAQGLNKKPKAP